MSVKERINLVKITRSDLYELVENINKFDINRLDIDYYVNLVEEKIDTIGRITRKTDKVYRKEKNNE